MTGLCGDWDELGRADVSGVSRLPCTSTTAAGPTSTTAPPATAAAAATAGAAASAASLSTPDFHPILRRSIRPILVPPGTFGSNGLCDDGDEPSRADVSGVSRLPCTRTTAAGPTSTTAPPAILPVTHRHPLSPTSTTTSSPMQSPAATVGA